MANWKDDKDSGSWNFAEQPDKWGYLNNPRWAAEKASNQHNPCGHWHKVKPIQNAIPLPNLYGTGYNFNGQLGIDDTTIGYSIYTKITEDKTFSQITCGYGHSIALHTNGSLWSTGENTKGQLGLGHSDTIYDWTQIGTATDWLYIACGTYQSYAIKTDGTLYSCGENADGELGLGDDVDRDEFTKVGIDTNWIKVDGGRYHMVALKSTGLLYGSGYNGSGELGLGSGVSDVNVPTLIPETTWSDFSCAVNSTMAIKTDGSLWGFGSNWSGMFGVGDQVDEDVPTNTSITGCSKISLGYEFSLVLKTNGTIWGAGFNSSGELGQNNIIQQLTLIQIGSASNWVTVSAGRRRTGVINSSDELFVCGAGGLGELGNDFALSTLILTKVDIDCSYFNAESYYCSFIIDTNNNLYSSGGNSLGSIGIGYDLTRTTLTLCNDSIWTAISSWDNHTLGIKNDGSVYGTGIASYGQLGFGSNGGYVRYRFTQLPVTGTYDQVACGAYHSLLLSGTTIYAAGWNSSGQLGKGSVSYREYTFITISGTWSFIAAGSAVSMAIDTNGLLYSTGDNSGGNNGQLGLGDSVNRSSFTQCIGTGWKQVSVGG